jgi:DNA-binding NarL/FixJ family response regulator
MEIPAQKRTLLVDDHLLFMEGIISILNKHKEIVIAATATSAEEALELFKKESFDFLITDISLPGINGIELIKEVRKTKSNIPTLVLSMRKGRELVEDILAAEVEGYLLKNCGKKELFEAIDKIFDGRTHYSSEITTYMMEIISSKKYKEKKNISVLTTREKEILQLICNELSTKQIAGMLHLTNSTVESHRNSMFQKTGARSVVGLIKYAVENDLVSW